MKHISQEESWSTGILGSGGMVVCVFCSLCIFHSSHICMQYLVSFLVLSGTPALLARTMSPSLRGGAKRAGVGYAALVLGVGIAGSWTDGRVGVAVVSVRVRKSDSYT